MTEERQFTVAQRFLSKPFLIEKRKFHARMYVLVTSYYPLFRGWISVDGFIFHSTAKHDLNDVSSLVFSQVSSTVLSRPLSDLWKQVRAIGGDPARVWTDTRLVLSRIFEAYTHAPPFPGGPFTQPFDRNKHGDCFDMFGVDMLYDERLNPYVLEINTGPNIVIDGRYQDQQIKVKARVVQAIVEWIRLKQAWESDLGAPLNSSFASGLEERALADESAGGVFQRLGGDLLAAHEVPAASFSSK